MVAAVQRNFENGLAPATARSYASAKSRYFDFCRMAGLSPLPLTEQCLCLFVSYLASQSVQYQSLKCYLSALRHLQIEEGLPDPRMGEGNFPRLEYVLKGIKRCPHSVSPRRTRLPITPPIMRRLLGVWNDRVDVDGSVFMLWAASCLAFFGFLRSGEFTLPSPSSFDPSVHLARSDVAVDSLVNPSWISVVIKRSKTDPFRNGVTLYLGKTGDALCPVATMLAYLTIRQRRDGPLFLFSDGSPLTRTRFVECLHRALEDAGLDPGAYNGHSFLIGAATTAHQKGLQDSTIQMLGRWHSSAYKSYIRTPREELAGISRALVAGVQSSPGVGLLTFYS